MHWIKFANKYKIDIYFKILNHLKGMLNHNAVFREQLKKVASAINKKHTVLRKEIIKTSQVFETDNLPIFPYEVCFGLLRQIPQTNSLSASLIFFPFIQNVINLGFANEQMSRQIITLLTHIKSIPKFQSQQNEVKLQQIIMLLVSKNAIRLDNIAYTHSIINILLSLQNTRYKNVWSKSEAILTQIMLLFINELKDSQKDQKKIEFFLKFLSDIVLICKNQAPKWLIESPEPFLFLTVLNQIIEENYFKQNLADHQKIISHLTPIIRKQLNKQYQNAMYSAPNSPSKHWELTHENKLVILLRSGCKISRLYEHNFQIIEQVIKIATQKTHCHLKILGYESINYLFASSQWMSSMLASQSGDLFNFLLTTLFNTTKLLLSQNKQSLDLTFNFQIQKSSRIYQNNGIDFHPSQIPPSLEIKCIIKNIQQISFTLYSIYSQIYKIKLDQKIEGKPPLEKTYKFCQKTIFQIIKSVISKDLLQQTMQSVLKISQKFINLSGVFNDSPVCATYIKLMCKYCLPPTLKTISHRHIQINKMILNTANCLGNLFSTSCWVTVWKALQNYSIHYNRYLLGKEELQAQRQNDVQILYKSMDSIFTETPKYEDKYLLNIIQSLIEVTYECLQNNYSEEAKKIFAFQRIQQIYRLNLFRIRVIWPQLSSSLLIITTSKILYFRISALNLLNVLIPISLQYLQSHPQIEQSESSNYELMILQPWLNLSNCQFPQIRSELAVAVNKLIIDYGHIMTKGWKCILDVIANIKDLKSLQSVVETFLDKIDPHIMQVIEIIDEVQRNLTDANQKYLCLTLIWAIGDHAHKQNQAQILRKIYQLLLKPDQMFILGAEARHSSFYIFAELIVHNCIEKQPEFWRWIFLQIEKFYNYAIDKVNESKQKISFDEVLKSILTNLIKIYRKLFTVSKQWSDQSLISQKLAQFYLLGCRLLKFRQGQVYQSTLKQMKQIIILKKQQSIKIQEFFQFLESISQIYFVQNDTKILKCLIAYLPVDIYDILFQSFGRIHDKFSLIYKLIEKILLLRLQAEEKDIKILQMRIFFQEKTFFQFWRKFHGYIIAQEDPQVAKIYLEYLTKTLHKLILYEDYFYLGRLLNHTTAIIEKFPKDTYHLHTLELLNQIICLKNNETWLRKNVKSLEIPIWYIATQQIIRLSYIFDKEIPQQQSSKKVFSILYSILIQNHEITVKDFEIPAEYWISFYDNAATISHFIIDHYILSKRGFEDIINAEKIEKIMAFVYQNSLNYDQTNKSSQSKNFYDILFKVSTKRQTRTSLILERQSIIVQQLFSRVLLSFDDYFQTLFNQKNEKKEKDSKIQQEIKYVLKKLFNLEIESDIFESIQNFLIRNYVNSINVKTPIFKFTKAHLFYFHSCFAKCIKSPNNEIRTILSQIMEFMGEVLLSGKLLNV